MPNVAINFDQVPDKDIPVESGIYDFQILAAKLDQNAKKDGYNVVIDTKIAGPSESKFLNRKRTLYLSTKMETQLKRLCLSSGVTVGQNGFNTDDLVGKIFKASVQAGTYKNDSGVMKPSWEVDVYLIPGDDGFPKAS